MSDEKRIKDFEPATELLIDDWFAVDSPSQGTRKMQASMFQEGLQTQITANTENIALHSGQISTLQQAVGNIGDKVDVLGSAITVEEYSATKLYAVGEDCVYEGVRYKCITAIESPEAFTPSHWQAISIEGELNELNSRLPSDASWILLSGANYYCIYNGIVFIKVTNQALTSRTTFDIGTLPSEYRPSLRIDAPIIGGSYREYTGVLYVSTDGIIHAYTDTTANYWGMLIFPLLPTP